MSEEPTKKQPDRYFGAWSIAVSRSQLGLPTVQPLPDDSLLIMGLLSKVNSERYGLARLRPAPVIRSGEFNTDHSFSLQIGGSSDWAYRVETSTKLKDWSLLTELPSVGPITVLKDSAGESRWFYRVNAP